MIREVPALLVFLEGLASFLSPCVLPLVPVYIAYLAGSSIDDLKEGEGPRNRLLINSLGFILGFSVVFVLLGAAASGLGRFLLVHGDIIRKVSGVVVIVFGIFYTGIINIPFLNYERRLNLDVKGYGFLSSLVLGIGFSFGWTPCIGPMLSSVLIMAGRLGTLYKGVVLLAVYSAGLALPFLVLAVGIRYLYKYLEALKKHMGIIKIIGGILLIIIGIMIYIDYFSGLGGFY
jgi:cytochrome c-type biogenesis protein